MSRFMNTSKFRHVFGTPHKRELCYDNLKISPNAWDSNIVKVNSKFLSINWNAGGGGAFAVVPLESTGKLPGDYPLFTGHSGTVLDTDFANFNEYVIASGAEDAKIMIWNIPEVFPEENIQTPAITLSGHQKKVGHVLFHPTADNVLASSSADLTVKLWDIENGKEVQELTGHNDLIQSITYNWNGSLLATTCRDKKVRVFDIRSNQIVQEGASHEGIKGSRAVWLGNTDRIATTGFSRTSERQLFLWDTKDLSKPLKKHGIDSSSGILMPYFDADVNLLYVAGKGDGSIRYFEYAKDDFSYLSTHSSNEPQRGMSFMPKRGLNVNQNEVARCYRIIGNNLVEPISFTVPRKAENFQHDIFPETPGPQPALTAEQFFNGETKDPILISLENGFVSAPKKELKTVVNNNVEQRSTPPVNGSDSKNYEKLYNDLKKEVDELNSKLKEKDTKITELEAELAKLKTNGTATETAVETTTTETTDE